MARKPLIEPGSVLPPTDMLSRIVARDRLASGRTPSSEETSPATPSAPTTQSVPKRPEDSSNITSNITAHTRSNPETQEEIFAETHADALPAAKEGRRKETKEDGKTERKASTQARAQQHAHQLAQSRPIPITLRLPEALNDWLDEYAHTHRKQGIKKQDLIARAVQLLVVEVSAEETRLEGGEA